MLASATEIAGHVDNVLLAPVINNDQISAETHTDARATVPEIQNTIPEVLTDVHQATFDYHQVPLDAHQVSIDAQEAALTVQQALVEAHLAYLNDYQAPHNVQQGSVVVNNDEAHVGTSTLIGLPGSDIPNPQVSHHVRRPSFDYQAVHPERRFALDVYDISPYVNESQASLSGQQTDSIVHEQFQSNIHLDAPLRDQVAVNDSLSYRWGNGELHQATKDSEFCKFHRQMLTGTQEISHRAGRRPGRIRLSKYAGVGSGSPHDGGQGLRRSSRLAAQPNNPGAGHVQRSPSIDDGLILCHKCFTRHRRGLSNCEYPRQLNKPWYNVPPPPPPDDNVPPPPPPLPPPPDEPTTCQFCHTRHPHTSECAREYLRFKNRPWHNVNEFEFFPEDTQQPRIKAEPRSPSPFPSARHVQIKQEPQSPREFSEPYGTLVRQESQVGLSIISPQMYPSSGNLTLSLTSISTVSQQSIFPANARN